MNASDRRALKLITQSKGDVRASLKSFLSKPKPYKKPLQKVREAKEQKERLSKRERRAAIRAAVFKRAGGYCELSGAPGPTEWHHLLGGNGRRQQKESWYNTMAVTQAAHIAYHRDPAHFASIVAAWCAKYGYDPITRIEHAPLARKLSRASGAGAGSPLPSSSVPDARDLSKVNQ